MVAVSFRFSPAQKRLYQSGSGPVLKYNGWFCAHFSKTHSEASRHTQGDARRLVATPIL